MFSLLNGRYWYVRICVGLLFSLLVSGEAGAQHAELRKVARRDLPTRTDGNSPAVWHNGKLTLFSSIGQPELISQARDQFGPWETAVVEGSLQSRAPVWVESAWVDSDGVLFAWYHHEVARVCGDASSLTMPEIGAAVSFDGGKTLEDLGIILRTGEDPNCDARNGYFAGGHGDFSVVPDRDHRFFYFVFTNYGGTADEQGVAIARMAFEDRFGPAGTVWKFRDGDWNAPGLGGRVTAIYGAQETWESERADSLWGPSVHWNTYLEKYVVLMNRACCAVGWPQEGIYISYISELGNPSNSSKPTKLMDGENIGFRAGFYPQVMGLEFGETDSISGWHARFYIQGISKWEIMFLR